jgi:sensor histidine kinase YesM
MAHETKMELYRHEEIRKYLNGQITRRELKNLIDSIRTLAVIEPRFLEDEVKDFSDIFAKLCK